MSTTEPSWTLLRGVRDNGSLCFNETHETFPLFEDWDKCGFLERSLR
jgi:hypothetical protein